VDAFTPAHPAEVEPQRGHAGLLQRASRAEHHLEVHDAALAWMGVADDARGRRRGIGLHEDALEPPGGTGDVEGFDHRLN
jgi:hypothetical protein